MPKTMRRNSDNVFNVFVGIDLSNHRPYNHPKGHQVNYTKQTVVDSFEARFPCCGLLLSGCF
jgi:hypothetical protein